LIQSHEHVLSRLTDGGKVEMNGIQTLARALDILFVLAKADTTLSVSDISEKVSIPETMRVRPIVCYKQTLEQNGSLSAKAKVRLALACAF
jgi:DNA-binding IclR family transcriptional regulator